MIMDSSPTSTVSVALCTHNGERFISDQLDSIFAQTVLPTEVVISDDASTDSTLERVADSMRTHSALPVAVTVLRNESALGVTGNFEQAIRACSGDPVFLSDQDDVWSPRRIERTLAEFSRWPDALLVHSDARLVDADGSDIGATLFAAYSIDDATIAEARSGGAFDLLLRRNLVTGATAAIRRGLVELAAPFPDWWVHDEWLALVAAANGPISPIRDLLIDYRQHGGNQIGAVEITFRAKLGRLVAPGFERNRRLLMRTTMLAERFPHIDRSPTVERAAAVAAKVAHERIRSSLSPHRLQRVLPVLREARTGRYGRYGGGLRDIARDLIQPLKPAS